MLMQTLEFALLNGIQRVCRGELLDWLMPLVSSLCNHGEIWIVLALALLLFKKHRRAGAAVALALGLDFLCCNLLLKPLIGRLRPCHVNPAVSLLIPCPGDFSFPSGHTAASFAAVGALWGSGSRLRFPALGLAVLIAFSRLYLYVHWPSDVLGGVVLGLALGFAACYLCRCPGRHRTLWG